MTPSYTDSSLEKQSPTMTPGSTVRNPRSSANEFMGPVGTFFMTFLVPSTAYALFFICNEKTSCDPFKAGTWRAALQGALGEWPEPAGRLWDWRAAALVYAVFLYAVFCWAVIPVQAIEGTVLRDGRRLTYWMNSLPTAIFASIYAIGLFVQPYGVDAMTWPLRHWVPMLSAALSLAFIQATWCYLWSFVSGELLAAGGNSGNFIYDWFIGRPLNPRFPGTNFDIKTFNENRPGFLLWMMLNVSCACEQIRRFGSVSNSMVLVLLFEAFYCFDSWSDEAVILNQIDIKNDGFGFMLAVGDLVWVPFAYGLQARYLSFNPVDLSYPALFAILAVELCGMYVFRAANGEKHQFRNGNNPKGLSFLQTKRGTKLLTSGWWGRSRHPNYFGDWLMALGWCLPTGFKTPFTYFYLAYFIVLLTHRQRRDDEICREKYGDDWDTYCKLVPFRIIPYIY